MKKRYCRTTSLPKTSIAKRYRRRRKRKKLFLRYLNKIIIKKIALFSLESSQFQHNLIILFKCLVMLIRLFSLYVYVMYPCILLFASLLTLIYSFFFDNFE